MSYEKVKNITRKPKEGKIFITSACNNLRPLTYSRWEYGKKYSSYKEKLQHLARDVASGNLQLNNSCYDWNYALLKATEQMRAKYGRDYDLYDLSTMNCTTYCLGKKLHDYYVSMTDEDLKNGDYILDWESKDGSTKTYYKASEYHNEQARIAAVLEEYSDVFMNYLDEKNDGKYCLYSDIYGNIKPKGVNGAFYYNSIEIMDYKRAYCLANAIGRDVKVVATDL